MRRKKLNPIAQALWQAPLLILLSVAVSIPANQWRSDGIALVGDWSEAARISDAEGNSLVIELSQAKHLFDQDAAVFVDARSGEQYAEGHIKGAVSLPWQGVERYLVEVAERLEGPRPIIAYCDGERCELSHELAMYLKEVGFENTQVLVNGWTVWREAGFPMDTGR